MNEIVQSYLNLDLSFLRDSNSIVFGFVTFLIWVFTFLTASSVMTYLVEPAMIKKGFASLIDQSPLKPGQIRREIFYSLSSVAFSGLAGGLLIYGSQKGFLKLDWSKPTWPLVLGQLALLTLWNEIHFYGMHRLLHTRWLFKGVHHIHHWSFRPTAFSGFSFHPFEAFLLNSVIILPLFLVEVNIWSILLFPVISYSSNLIGHCNLRMPITGAVTVGHVLHHQKVRGNYGFWTLLLDQIAGTKL